MLKKLYWAIALILVAKNAIEQQSMDELQMGLICAVMIYFEVKLVIYFLKIETSKKGGFLKSLFFGSILDTQNVTNWIWTLFANSGYDVKRTTDQEAYDRKRAANQAAYDRKRAADQAVYERTKARNEAMYHEYYAKKNQGTYDGYRSKNRANEAWNRANK